MLAGYPIKGSVVKIPAPIAPTPARPISKGPQKELIEELLSVLRNPTANRNISAPIIKNTSA